MDYGPDYYALFLMKVGQQVSGEWSFLALGIEPNGITLNKWESDAVTEIGAYAFTSARDTWYDIQVVFSGTNNEHVAIRHGLHGGELPTVIDISTGLTNTDTNVSFAVGEEGGYLFDNLRIKADSISAESMEQEFIYDVFGRRVAKTTYENYIAKTSYYAYDGDQVIEELDGDANVEASFVYGGQYIDEVLQLKRDTTGDGTLDTTYYYLHDDLYNVLALTDEDGDIVERYEYGDYGYPTVFDSNNIETGNVSAYGNPYLFTGRRWDADTELYWYRTRYMDPALGRFISRDQIGLWGDENNLGNPFAYAGNNPWTYTDPYGEYIESGWDALSLGIGVASLGYNLSEGNYGSAALDALGVVLDGAALAVPLIPGGAGAAIKGIRVLNAVDTTINVGMAAHGTVDAIQQGDALGAAMQAGFGALGAGSLGRHANLPGGRGAQNLSAGGGNVGQGIGRGCNCFTEDTLVQTADGPVPIDEVEAGTEVYALDEETGGVELASVTALFKRTAQSTYRIEVGGGVIETTREHPFFVEGTGWTEAQDLREGDLVDTLDGFTLPVTGIEVVYEPTTVYNFSVNGLHNYYVSDDGVLVHNVGCKWKPKGFQDHHIISDKNPATKHHELLELAGGFNLQSRRNKMFLPKTPDLHPTRSIHNGKHPQNHSDEIAGQMDRVVKKGRKAGYSTAQYDEALQSIVSTERQLLRSGKRALNKHKRYWAE